MWVGGWVGHRGWVCVCVCVCACVPVCLWACAHVRVFGCACARVKFPDISFRIWFRVIILQAPPLPLQRHPRGVGSSKVFFRGPALLKAAAEAVGAAAAAALAGGRFASPVCGGRRRTRRRVKGCSVRARPWVSLDRSAGPGRGWRWRACDEHPEKVTVAQAANPWLDVPSEAGSQG